MRSRIYVSFLLEGRRSFEIPLHKLGNDPGEEKGGKFGYKLSRARSADSPVLLLCCQLVLQPDCRTMLGSNALTVRVELGGRCDVAFL